jgi:hypothetical protein
MEEESLGSEVDTEYARMFLMSYLRHMDKESISTQDDIGAFMDGCFEFLHYSRVEELLDS